MRSHLLIKRSRKSNSFKTLTYERELSQGRTVMSACACLKKQTGSSPRAIANKHLKFHCARELRLAVCFGLLATCSITRSQTYQVGFTWARSNDWINQPATATGTETGNPNTDFTGAEVWDYQWISGGSNLDGPSPWYLRPTTRMVWDTVSHDLPATGSWKRVNTATNPAASQSSLLHGTLTYSETPAVTWRNPTGKSIPLRITGNLTLEWQGPQIQPVGVEIAITKQSAGGLWQPLFLNSIEKPTNNSSPEIKKIPLDLFTTADNTDSIRLSLRIAGNSGDMRLLLRDALCFTIVTADIDGDGISNTLEQRSFGTDPTRDDTDGDGWNDQAEIEFRGDASDPAMAPAIQPSISVNPIVHEATIRFPTRRTCMHAVETSDDMLGWATFENGISGEGDVVTRSIPVAGKSRKFIRVEQSTPALDPAVAAYRDAAGIPAESADKINTLLAELRGAGMNPSFLWVGGGAYNQPDQARAVIGGSGEVVGAGTFVPFGEKENGCRFNRGKFLQFNQPANLRADSVENLAVAIWFEETDYSEISRLLSTYDSAARGFRLTQTTSGEIRFSSFLSALGANNADFYPVPTWSRMVMNRSQYYRLERISPTTTRIHSTLETDAGIRDIGLIYNNHSKIHIGGESLTATSTNSAWGLANCRITALAIAPDGPKTKSVPAAPGTAIAADQTLNITNAPYRAGIIPKHALPMVLSLGDSTTAAQWNAFAFSNCPEAGAWFNQAVVEDYAVGGTSMDSHMALTPYIKQALTDVRFQPRYFIYTPEEILPSAAITLGLPPTDGQAWYDLMETWLKEISRETGCKIVLCSYIKGNNADSSTGEANRIIVKTMAHANGWAYIPLREEPHSQVWTGGVPGSYGFYQDAIHQTSAGARIQAEVFSASIPHPYDTLSPRADIDHPPVISGTLSVGGSLSCSTGKWFNKPATFSYQWLRNLVAIPGATSNTYVIQTSDGGNRLACRVTAATPDQRPASFTAAPTKTVTP